MFKLQTAVFVQLNCRSGDYWFYCGPNLAVGEVTSPGVRVMASTDRSLRGSNQSRNYYSAILFMS